jgi:hypothetical protein
MRWRVPRRAVWWGVCSAVLLAHLLVTSGLADDLLGDGWAGRPARIRAMEVSYVSELALTLEPPPPVVVTPMPPMQPVRKLKPVVPVAQAASAPDLVIDEPEPLSPTDVAVPETPETPKPRAPLKKSRRPPRRLSSRKPHPHLPAWKPHPRLPARWRKPPNPWPSNGHPPPACRTA